MQADPSHSDILVSLTEHPVLLTAPHGKLHVRDGVPKNREDNTSRLAVLASRLSGAGSVVLVTASDEDGNWDADSRFRRHVGSILRADPGILLDIHGMRDHHGPDLVIGTAGGRAPGWLVELAADAAGRFELSAEVRHHGLLSAGPRTLTAYALGTLGMPAIQLELAARVRDAYRSPAWFDTVVRFLAALAAEAAASFPGAAER